ncbi:MAG: hypothetical protein K8R21_04060 [Leptospira sp.]|nr:hypothetical protein [Leptospira sp.]
MQVLKNAIQMDPHMEMDLNFGPRLKQAGADWKNERKAEIKNRYPSNFRIIETLSHFVIVKNGNEEISSIRNNGERALLNQSRGDLGIIVTKSDILAYSAGSRKWFRQPLRGDIDIHLQIGSHIAIVNSDLGVYQFSEVRQNWISFTLDNEKIWGISIYGSAMIIFSTAKIRIVEEENGKLTGIYLNDPGFPEILFQKNKITIGNVKEIDSEDSREGWLHPQ